MIKWKPFHISLIKPGSQIDRFFEKQLNSSFFTYKQIFAMLLPLILDQFFISIIGLLTTAMISSSSPESVSAVGLVNPLSLMIYAIFNAISAGGTVIVAQYKGRNNKEQMRKAAGQVMVTTSALAIISCIILILFAEPLLSLLFTNLDPIVLKKSCDYLVGIAISLIFLSFYMGAFAVFRGLGETKKCLLLSMIINLIHLFASFLFINVLRLDILGTTLSLNIARFIGAVVGVWLLMYPKSVLRVYPKDIFHINWSILKSISRIGFPFALEQIFFNGGSLLVQIYIAVLGTASVAANTIANSALGIVYSTGLAVGTLSITIIGQCIGADDKVMAKKYGNKMLLLGTAAIAISIVVFLPLMPLILKLYRAPAENLHTIYKLLLTAIVPMPFFWTISNVMPCVLRAAGDVIFGSVVSLITMWIIRVLLGYIFAIWLKLGVEGVWIAMGLEWAVRTVVFYYRYRSGVWLNKTTIE